jgi:hypothetical protein
LLRTVVFWVGSRFDPLEKSMKKSFRLEARQRSPTGFMKGLRSEPIEPVSKVQDRSGHEVACQLREADSAEVCAANQTLVRAIALEKRLSPTGIEPVSKVQDRSGHEVACQLREADSAEVCAANQTLVRTIALEKRLSPTGIEPVSKV